MFRPPLRGHCTAGVCCELREAVVLSQAHSNRSALCLYSSACYLQSNSKHINAKIRPPTTTSIYTLQALAILALTAKKKMFIDNISQAKFSNASFRKH